MRRERGKDCRYYHLYATEKAMKMHPSFESLLDYDVDVLLKGFSEEELHQLHSYLDRLNMNLVQELECRDATQAE